MHDYAFFIHFADVLLKLEIIEERQYLKFHTEVSDRTYDPWN